MKAAARVCSVCNRDEGRTVTLASGRQADLCKDCSKDNFRLAEAERRARAKETGEVFK
jgi:hypothetical protein